MRAFVTELIEGFASIFIVVYTLIGMGVGAAVGSAVGTARQMMSNPWSAMSGGGGGGGGGGFLGGLVGGAVFFFMAVLATGVIYLLLDIRAGMQEQVQEQRTMRRRLEEQMGIKSSPTPAQPTPPLRRAPTPAWKCPECGTHVPAGREVCWQCGANLAQ